MSVQDVGVGFVAAAVGLRDEDHLLPQTLADYGVVAVQPERQRLANERRLDDELAHQRLGFGGRRRTPPSRLEACIQAANVGRRDNKPIGICPRARIFTEPVNPEYEHGKTKDLISDSLATRASDE